MSDINDEEVEINSEIRIRATQNALLQLNINHLISDTMKRILTIFAAIVSAAVSALAQDSGPREKASHYYVTTEFNLTGADFQGWGKPDFGSYGFTVSPGYRFNPHWAVFVPVNAEVLLINRQSTKNFIEQGTLGLGGSYTLTMKDHMALEFVVSCNSTYIKSDLNYFKAKAAVNFGFHGLGGTPYVGIGCSYLSPYSNITNDKVMIEINLGFTIF